MNIINDDITGDMTVNFTHDTVLCSECVKIRAEMLAAYAIIPVTAMGDNQRSHVNIHDGLLFTVNWRRNSLMLISLR